MLRPARTLAMLAVTVSVLTFGVEAAAAGSSSTALMPAMMPPAPTIAEGVVYFRAELARYREAYDEGRFGEVLPADQERFDELGQQLDAIEASIESEPIVEMGQFTLQLLAFLQELASRPGADPLLVREIALISTPPGASPTLTLTSAPATAPPSTIAVASTAPSTSIAAATTSPATTVAATTVAPVTAAPATTPPTVVAVPIADEVVTGDTSDGWTIQTWQLLAAIGAAAVLAIALYVGERWYRARLPKPTGRPGFHDLMDVSRRLAGAGSAAEVEEMAVRQAMRLTHARSGAFIRHRDRRLSVGYETDDGLLVGDRLRDGALDRVVGTGHEVMQVSATEPSIRNLPVSLLAAPVFVGGAVHGAVVLVRPHDDPFADEDLRMLTDLKPIIGAAFEQVTHTEQVRAEALADGLTGVRNRRALDLDTADRGDTPFAAVMVDLDHFKSVNDTHGHQGGDELLRAVANRLVANVRPGDEVYRYGGEEFTIVLPHTDDTAAAEAAERVRLAIEGTPFVVGPARVQHRATASFGVASGCGGQQVFARADAALYEAKRSGRNRVIVAAADRVSG